MMLRDIIKALGKLLVCCSFGGHLKFHNGRHLDFKMAAIFNIFWTISQLLSYLESFQNGGNAHVCDAMYCNKSTWKVTGHCSSGNLLKF